MGVKGLASFIKENRQSLCRTVQLSAAHSAGEERIPVVIDAWGIVYSLWLASLPWQSGGEYLRFYRLVCRLIEAWREVGLEPTFVFDGSAPEEKLDTQLRRLDENLRTAQLFYTTSPASRSSHSFSRDRVILPPFASHTFIHALDDLDVSAHFVPLGEADGECVILAEQLSAYVIGQDSDFPILISSPGITRVRGYCPLEMMMWIEDDPGVKRKEALEGGTGWTSVTPTKKEKTTRLSPLLPPPDMRRPKLVMTSISPNALRQRLRLPAAMLPLFASLVGNDYTPPAAPDHFFSPGLNTIGKIEKVARVIREVVFSTQQSHVTSSSTDAGDHAVGLVRAVILKLAWKPFVSEAILRELVEAIIKATFQYILPAGGVCCGIYPFCGELDGMCRTRPPSRSVTPSENGVGDGEDMVQKAKKMYAMGQRKGILTSITAAWLYPQKVMLSSVLEDTSGTSLSATEDMRLIRQRAYLIAEEGLGGLRWPEVESQDEDQATEEDLLQQDGSVDGTEQKPEGESVSTMMEDLNCAEPPHTSESSVSNDSTTVVEEPIKPDEIPSRGIIEYVRHTNRFLPFRLDLPPPLSQSTPTCLLPLKDRIRIYLEPLSSAHDTMLALPPQIQPLAAITRFSLLQAATLKPESRWKRSEVEAVLKSFISNLSTWIREKRAKIPGRQDPELAYPLLTTRHCQIVAQLGVVMLDSLTLAQSLLLAPHTVTGLEPSLPIVGRRMPTLTHLTPWMFFSGVSIHSLLLNDVPPGWEWSDKEEAIFKMCLGAVMDGLDGETVKGWSAGGSEAQEVKEDRLADDIPKSKSGGKKSKEKKIEKKAGAAPEKATGMGRYSVLGASQA